MGRVLQPPPKVPFPRRKRKAYKAEYLNPFLTVIVTSFSLRALYSRPQRRSALRTHAGTDSRVSFRTRALSSVLQNSTTPSAILPNRIEIPKAGNSESKCNALEPTFAKSLLSPRQGEQRPHRQLCMLGCLGVAAGQGFRCFCYYQGDDTVKEVTPSQAHPRHRHWKMATLKMVYIASLAPRTVIPPFCKTLVSTKP